MGCPKALIVHEGRTFVERVLDALTQGGVARVVVVCRELECAAIAARVPHAWVVTNPDPERGMQSSIAVGLARLLDDTGGSVHDATASPRLHGVALALVDQPTLQAHTVRRVREVFADDVTRIVVPRSPEGRRGHPVIFPVDLIDQLRELHAQGAREVLWRNPHRVREVDLDDAGAFHDVNTPDELAALAPDAPPVLRIDAGLA